jgi:hypothetical protein
LDRKIAKNILLRAADQGRALAKDQQLAQVTPIGFQGVL